MILTLNILLSVIVVVGIVALLAYNIQPLHRPLRLDEAAPKAISSPAAFTSPYARRSARQAHAARRAAEHRARSLNSAHA